MSARALCILGLLFYHLLLVILFFCWGRTIPTTHWIGSLLTFGTPTVQFTWSFTVALILGPHRPYRRWYRATLLLSFIPLNLVGIVCWLAYHLIGASLAVFCLSVALAVLFLETYAGILYGNYAYQCLRKR